MSAEEGAESTGFVDEEIADAATLWAEVLRSVAARLRLRADGGSRPSAEAPQLSERLEAAAAILEGRCPRPSPGPRNASPALQESEERFRLLVESVRDYAIFMLDPEGRVASWNLGAEQLKGYRADEVLGQSFSIFYPPEDRARRRPEAALAAAAAEGRYAEEGWRVRKDGTRFPASVVLTALRGPGGEVVGYAKVTRDMSAWNEALRVALRARDEFLVVASHELRTPLTVIQLQLQAALRQLRRGEGPDERTVERLDRALRSSNRLAGLVSDLLDVSRLSSGRMALAPTRLDLAELVRGVVERYRPEAERAGCALAVGTPGTLLGTWDRKRLEQLVVSLLSNAVKYGAGRPVEIELEQDGAAARLRVRDQGIGIAAVDMGRIFGRFERAVPVQNYGGLGLGLFVAKQIVDAHGGRLGVMSTPGEGATFMVDLPIEPPDEAPPHEDPAADDVTGVSRPGGG